MRQSTLAVLLYMLGVPLVAPTSSSVATAGLVPGKGKAQTNCYVEYDVAGVSNPSARVQAGGGRVLCTDGDECDTDGLCGNNSCTISTSVCINQSDPNVAACSAPGGLSRVKVGPKKAKVVIPQLLQGAQCSTPVGVVVRIPTKKNGKPKKGFGSVKLTSSAKAVPGTKPGSASDSLDLRCVVRATQCVSTTLRECYNGVVDEGEACDTGPVDTLGCVKCQGPNSCGDGFLGGQEVCDDGNAQAGDGCSIDCRIEGGGLNATVSLDYDPQQILELVGVEFSLFDPTGKVAIPGSGDTDQVKARVTNLGNQGNQFQANDFDDRLFVVSGGTDASAFQPGPLTKVVFDLLPGQVAAAGEFRCEVSLAVDAFGLPVGPPTCSVTIATTPPPTTTSTTITTTTTSTSTTLPL